MISLRHVPPGTSAFLEDYLQKPEHFGEPLLELNITDVRGQTNINLVLTPEVLNSPDRIKKGFYTIGRVDPN